jgi:2-C-methyl-D-erythritol 4-phosphate cytidylyltransferase/2-C-methyl-D-erythritol 2,4-cyclodiphosphate synthase
VVVAAGSGRRFGGPKQFAALAGRPLVAHAVVAARSVAAGVVLVLPPDAAERPTEGLGADVVVAGGASRSESVRRGLAAVPPAVDVVLVHDGARPLATASLFRRVLSAVTGADGGTGADAVVPALVVADTVKEVEGDRVVGTLDRTRLVTAQTPQGFRRAALEAAHEAAGDATDDAALVESAGGTVRTVAGEPENRKITTPEDLRAVQSTMQSAVQEPAGGGEWGAGPVPRVGHGFDVHRFADDPHRRLVLGGVTVPEGPGLAGHSDADVVAHAVADALLGAAGLGDLGSRFPDSDPAWAGADSMGLLRAVVEAVHQADLQVGNVDCTVVCERPRLGGLVGEMQRRLGEAVGAAVSVKPKRAEGLGALGRVEGIAAMAVAVLGTRSTG